MPTQVVLIWAKPEFTLAKMHAAAMCRALEYAKDSVTFLSSGTASFSTATNLLNSSGSMTPAVSHTVMTPAPDSMPARMACARKSSSARVAS